MLRLVPSHPVARRPVFIGCSVCSLSAIPSLLSLSHTGKPRPFPLLPFTWVSAPAGRLCSIPIRLQLIPDCTRNLFSGWKIEDAFFLFVEWSTVPHSSNFALSFSVSTHMAVSVVFLSFCLSFCLSIYLSLVMGVMTLSCACACASLILLRISR